MAKTDLKTSVQQMANFLGKVHYIIFVAILLCVLGLTLITVLNIFNASSSSSQAYENELDTDKVIDNFEKNPTIPKINKLEFSDQSPTGKLPTNQRINPFSE